MIKTFRATSLVAMAALMCSTAVPAIAAEGYMLIGYGARQKALAGSDVADSRDGMAASVNPAGIVGLERQFQFGVTALLPERGYNAVGTLTIAPGDVRSGRPIFPVPNDAYVQPIDADSAWGTVSYGNGGINTAYSFGNFKAPFGGPFGGGFAGVDLEQGFFSFVYARRMGNFSLGVAPTLAAQMLNVQGLKTLAAYSSDRYSMSDDGYDFSVGGGR